MKIEVSLLSILSAAYLILFCVVSNQVILDNVEVDFSLSSSGLNLSVHPEWVVWVPTITALNHGGHGFAFGNVIVVGEYMRGGTQEEYVFNHERIHTEQFRALGWMIYPAQFVLPIEPPSGIVTNWDDPSQPGRTMWQPPKGWPLKWSFITITL